MSFRYAGSHHCLQPAQVQYQNVQVLTWIYLWPEPRVSHEAGRLISEIQLLGLKVEELWFVFIHRIDLQGWEGWEEQVEELDGKCKLTELE